jgi:hypothetical protein
MLKPARLRRGPVRSHQILSGPFVLYGCVVTVSVRDARASPSDRLWIENVYRDYLDDSGTAQHRDFPDPGRGRPSRARPDLALVCRLGLLSARHRQVRMVAVGFAMVARAAALAGRPDVDYRMAEFFIARSRAPSRHWSDGRADHLQPLRGTLGDQRISAQSRRGEFLAARGRGAHARRLSGKRSSTAKFGTCFSRGGAPALGFARQALQPICARARSARRRRTSTPRVASAGTN